MSAAGCGRPGPPGFGPPTPPCSSVPRSPCSARGGERPASSVSHPALSDRSAVSSLSCQLGRLPMQLGACSSSRPVRRPAPRAGLQRCGARRHGPAGSDGAPIGEELSPGGRFSCCSPSGQHQVKPQPPTGPGARTASHSDRSLPPSMRAPCANLSRSVGAAPAALHPALHAPSQPCPSSGCMSAWSCQPPTRTQPESARSPRRLWLRRQWVCQRSANICVNVCRHLCRHE